MPEKVRARQRELGREGRARNEGCHIDGLRNGAIVEAFYISDLDVPGGIEQVKLEQDKAEINFEVHVHSLRGPTWPQG